MKNSKLIDSDETCKIIGSAFEIYKELRNGFWENVYQECLEIEFSEQSIPYISQPEIHMVYKGRKLQHKYKPDFICCDKIIGEIKAMDNIRGEHEAQVINYLKATGMKLGLLINFGSHPKVEIKRLINLDKQ